MLLPIFGSHIATALLLLFITAPSWLLIAALDYSTSWYLSITWQDLLDQHYMISNRFVLLWYADVLLQLVHLNQWPELLQSPPLTQFVAITHFIFLSHCYCIVTVIIIASIAKENTTRTATFPTALASLSAYCCCWEYQDDVPFCCLLHCYMMMSYMPTLLLHWT